MRLLLPGRLAWPGRWFVDEVDCREDVPRAIGDFQGRKVVLLAGCFLFSDCLSHGLRGVGPGRRQIMEFDPDPVGNDRSADQSNVEEIAGHRWRKLIEGRRSGGIIASMLLVEGLRLPLLGTIHLRWASRATTITSLSSTYVSGRELTAGLSNMRGAITGFCLA